ncbi:hypothetical protein ASPACDRAFT_119651 [Aspergillus aculeatus ATCC 16872]|uniref:Uncharacterized protein n=1 Tax=Aspergillus aculeatus (strain ATCC 16872 / CBS 172.66 / WB 5094) TaxID=690307 RepID=A0A1L9WUD3_ASPA1|nr:uncharacterized protein ASPACDRAFT_119651 [Aspergillus aculeatus ATCC 16872]OJJ99854.1 hypothetical protein ASPACDRAFT_119651 [Aspergillus aculeatus ATCC 16872]
MVALLCSIELAPFLSASAWTNSEDGMACEIYFEPTNGIYTNQPISKLTPIGDTKPALSLRRSLVSGQPYRAQRNPVIR